VLKETTDAEALAETVLKLFMDSEVAEVDAEPEATCVLRLASEAETWALRLVVDTESVLKLARDSEYSDCEAADKDLVWLASVEVNALTLALAVEREALAVERLASDCEAILVEAVDCDVAALCETADWIAMEVEASLASEVARDVL